MEYANEKRPSNTSSYRHQLETIQQFHTEPQPTQF